MRNVVNLIIFCLGIISCDKPFNKKPENLLSKSEMADILTDHYLNQQMVNGSAAKDGNYILALAENTVANYNKHNVTRQDFEANYRYYYTKPKEFQKILDKVKNNLSDKLSEEEKQRLAEILKNQEEEK